MRRYCPAGSGPGGVQCPSGRFSAGGAVTECSACPAGRFGALNLANGLTSAACSGPCPAGMACPEGSTSATMATCAEGSYSIGSQGSCTPCAAGLYGSTKGLTGPACSGVCPSGRYSSLGSSGCSDCTAAPGSYCPSNSASPVGVQCENGKYGPGGSSPGCTLCPAGRFAIPLAVLSNSLCSGPCRCVRWSVVRMLSVHVCVPSGCAVRRLGHCVPRAMHFPSPSPSSSAGYICPTPGSTTPTPTKCIAGTFSTAGATVCTPCSPGTWGELDGESRSGCSGDCPPGTYSSTGATSCQPCTAPVGCVTLATAC